MSGSSRNVWSLESLLPGQDYVPNNRFVSRQSDYIPNFRGSTRDSWWSLEERLIGGTNNGLASLPSATLPHFPVRYLLIDDNNPYPRARNTLPDISSAYYDSGYNQTSAEEESRLSAEQQTKAINNLRKQLYNPHMSNIVKRLGSKFTSNEAKSFLQDDDGKRCAVCLEDFETKQFVMLTPCNHMFHEECIVPWVKSHGKCPVCRFVFSEQNAPSRSSNYTTMRGRDLISVIRAFNQAY